MMDRGLFRRGNNLRFFFPLLHPRPRPRISRDLLKSSERKRERGGKRESSREGQANLVHTRVHRVQGWPPRESIRRNESSKACSLARTHPLRNRDTWGRTNRCNFLRPVRHMKRESEVFWVSFARGNTYMLRGGGRVMGWRSKGYIGWSFRAAFPLRVSTTAPKPKIRVVRACRASIESLVKRDRKLVKLRYLFFPSFLPSSNRVLSRV